MKAPATVVLLQMATAPPFANRRRWELRRCSVGAPARWKCLKVDPTALGKVPHPRPKMLNTYRSIFKTVVMGIAAFVLCALAARPALPVSEHLARRGGGFDCVRLQHVRPPPIPLSSPKEEIIFVPCRESYDPTWPEV
jgi:hypothetical protein